MGAKSSKSPKSSKDENHVDTRRYSKHMIKLKLPLKIGDPGYERWLEGYKELEKFQKLDSEGSLHDTYSPSSNSCLTPDK